MAKQHTIVGRYGVEAVVDAIDFSDQELTQGMRDGRSYGEMTASEIKVSWSASIEECKQDVRDVFGSSFGNVGYMVSEEGREVYYSTDSNVLLVVEEKSEGIISATASKHVDNGSRLEQMHSTDIARTNCQASLSSGGLDGVEATAVHRIGKDAEQIFTDQKITLSEREVGRDKVINNIKNREEELANDLAEMRLDREDIH